MSDSNNIEVVPVEREGPGRWRTFTSRHPDTTPFHTLAWKQAVESTFAYESRFYYVYVNGELAGVVPLFRTPSVIGSDITQPFCEYGSPLLRDGVDQAGVMRALTQEVGRLDTLTIKDAGWSRSRGWSSSGYGGISTGCTFRLRLNRPFEDILESRFDTEVRRSLRKADEAGVKIREGRVTEYYPVYVETMRRLGSPQFPRRFFEALQSSFEDDVTVLLATHEESVVAGVLMIGHGDESMVWSNASLEHAWEYKPNYLLYARAVQRSVSSGRSVLDFGRTAPDSGVYQFKDQFGGDEFELMSMVYPAHRRNRASFDEYRLLQPLLAKFGGVITSDAIGPTLKEWIHE